MCLKIVKTQDLKFRNLLLDKDESMFDFRNWQDPGPSVKCHPLHDFCGLPKRDFIISAVMTPS